MAKITLERVEKRFGNVTAVDGIDLVIDDGGFTVLLGPSGCGKTTTLNMIAGLEEPTGGRILFDDEEVQDIPVHLRDIAMVFQSYALYPNRSVRDNIAFGLKMRKVPKAEAAARVAAAAERLAISELLDRRPRQLSGGQQQRVALARAIVRRPRVFLLDEPLSNLDAKLRATMRIELKALQQEIGGTFVHVTHDQSEAMSMADRVVVMQHGRIQQAAAPRELYARPANVFVASFVGTPQMNLIEGSVEAGRFQTAGWSTPVDGVVDGPVTLGIRAEDLHRTDEAGHPSGTVRVVEHLGSDTIVVLGYPFGDLLARLPASVEVAVGDRLAVEPDRTRLHLFDAAGERIAGVPAPSSASPRP